MNDNQKIKTNNIHDIHGNNRKKENNNKGHDGKRQTHNYNNNKGDKYHYKYKQKLDKKEINIKPIIPLQKSMQKIINNFHKENHIYNKNLQNSSKTSTMLNEPTISNCKA